MPILFTDLTLIAGKVSPGFPGGAAVKNLPSNAGAIGDAGSLPGWEDPLEEMATHCRVPARLIPLTEEPGGLHPMGLQRIRHD